MVTRETDSWESGNPTATSLSHSELKCVCLSTRISFNLNGDTEVKTNRPLEAARSGSKATVRRCGRGDVDALSLAGPEPRAAMGGVRLLCYEDETISGPSRERDVGC